LLLDGAIHRGRNGAAGEIGHTAVVIGGRRCACGKRGCWETVATLRWLRRTARTRGIRGARQLDAARLAELAATGDTIADDLMDEYADHLAIGLANLDQTLGTELIIVHGDAVGGGEQLLERIRAATHRRATRPVEVRFTELTDAALLGAAGVVLSALLHAASTS
jgi:predicted NBD/HSP70 family sugar kinase